MIVEMFEALEATTKRSEKEAILRQHDSALVRAVFHYALNPFLRFHIQSMRVPLTTDQAEFYSDNEESWHIFLNLLEALCAREVTGSRAREYAASELRSMPPEMRKWAFRILQKNLRCGVEVATVNKVFPDLVPEFSVMLAHDLDCARDLKGDISIRERVSYPVWCDRKFDGIRVIAVRDEDDVTLFTRTGKVIETLPRITEAVRALPPLEASLLWEPRRFVLDGEVMGRDWNETQSTVFAKVNVVSDEHMTYHVFDIIPLDTWVNQGETEGYVIRMCRLPDAPPTIRRVQGQYVHSNEELLQLLQDYRWEGLEGVMIKSISAPYQFKRTTHMRKMKPKQTWEGKIVGWEKGKGKYAEMFGAFKVLIDGVITSVGGGFTDSQRKDLTADLEDDPKCYWGTIAEVEAQEMTEDGKLRFPVFKRFRNKGDK